VGKLINIILLMELIIFILEADRPFGQLASQLTNVDQQIANTHEFKLNKCKKENQRQ
jgi:hypothetical protein